jgi:hypothetical protein
VVEIDPAHNSSAKALTAYSISGLSAAPVSINESAKSIAVTVPYGTNVTALVATYSSTGISVKVGSIVQTSAVTSNDFTNPVVYSVTAADSSMEFYTVSVIVAASQAMAITTYSFAGYAGAAGSINEAAKIISVLVPFGTNLSALVATFTTTGAVVRVAGAVQASNATANDFSTPVRYAVTAADASTAIYTVIVTTTASSAKAVTAYSFAGYAASVGTINEAAGTIAVNVPFGTNVTALIAKFSVSGSGVKVGATDQFSNVTPNDFTGPVVYTLAAADGSMTNYTVTVTVAASSARAITAFSFAGYTSSAGSINEAAKTIAVMMPFGTNVTGLVAAFSTTGTSVKVGTTVQTSSATTNDFTSPVVYTVIAADTSTANYTVTVAVAADTAKAMTAFSFVGYSGAVGTINESAKTIAVTVPFGTDVTSLVATFTSTGVSVIVGTTSQTSAATANNFSGPVSYIVTAADTLTATYIVTVTVAANTAKAMTAFSFAGYTGAAGTINESAKTIAVTVPFGTNVTALIATFTSTGANVLVGAAVQTSTATANDFTSPVAYIVTAADASTAIYTVTVTLALNTAKALTAYSFVGHTGAAGTINEASKTIAVTLPFGTSVTNLIATFTTTGNSVQVGSTVQTSTATANDFTSPVAYIVTAADASTATYTVTVTLASNTDKAITAYSFAGFTDSAGTINEAAKTIAVTVPPGTTLTALVATYTTTGASVQVGATVQTSATTANDFTSPVVYTVYAADASTVNYTVTVSLGTGPTPVLLGMAGNYAIFANTGIYNVTFPAAITGNMGVGPDVTSTAITGPWDLSLVSSYSTSTQVNGNVYAHDYDIPTPDNVTTASANMVTAYNDAVGRAPEIDVAFLNVGNGDIGDKILAPGTYTWNSAVILPSGKNVTLSGGPNDVWIFQINGALTTSDYTSVLLTGGALPKNIFWQVNGAATLGISAHFEGVVLAKEAINLGSLASANSRLLAQTAVKIDRSTVTQPDP